MIWILLLSFDGKRKPEQQGWKSIAESTKRMTQFISVPTLLAITCSQEHPRTTSLPNLSIARPRLLDLSVSISFVDS